MAKKITPLTDTQIKTAKAKDKNYSLYDGDGLLLLVKTNSCKIWQFRYYKPFINKRTTISFGSYPEVSLQQARKQREEARKLIKQDIDPKEQREAEKWQQKNEFNNTFYAVAGQWFQFKTHQGLEKITLKKAWRSLENHVFPYIKEIPISQVAAVKAIKAL